MVLSRACVSERLVSRLQDDRTVEILEDLVLRYGDDKCPEYITFPERTKLVASEDVRTMTQHQPHTQTYTRTDTDTDTESRAAHRRARLAVAVWWCTRCCCRRSRAAWTR